MWPNPPWVWINSPSFPPSYVHQGFSTGRIYTIHGINESSSKLTPAHALLSSAFDSMLINVNVSQFV